MAHTGDKTMAADRKLNLTKKVVESLTTTSPKQLFHDTSTPHLCIQVTSAGCKTWCLYRRINGQPKQVKIGRYPEVTPDQAKRLAQQLNGQIAQGIDPTEKRPAEEMTFGDLFEKYIELHGKPHKRTWKRDQHRYEVYLEKRLGKRLLAKISTEDIQAVHVQLGAKHGTGQANVIRTLLSSVFNFAKKMKYWSGENPVHQVRRYPVNERERFLAPEEMPKFFTALKRANAQIFRDYVLLSLFTGARQGNILAMRWSQIDFTRKIWTIPASEHKSKKVTKVTLSDPAIVILKRRAKEATTDYVLPGRVSGHYGRPTVAWKRQMTRCGFPEHVTMHDLRRTLGSWQANAGTSLHIIGASLGQRSTSATAIYSRLNESTVRSSVDAAVQAMMDAAEGGGK